MGREIGKINVSKETLSELEKEYNLAVKKNKESFLFRGNLLLVSYAKYLIEYLQNELKIKK